MGRGRLSVQRRGLFRKFTSVIWAGRESALRQASWAPDELGIRPAKALRFLTSRADPSGLRRAAGHSGIPSTAILRSRCFSQFQLSFPAESRWVPASPATSAQSRARSAVGSSPLTASEIPIGIICEGQLGQNRQQPVVCKLDSEQFFFFFLMACRSRGDFVG